MSGFQANAPAAFAKLLEVLPFSLAVRETMRMCALSALGALPMPILDVGCGDGLFWEVVTRNLGKDQGRYLSGLLGIDVNGKELQLASMRLRQTGASLEIADISDANASLGGGRLEGLARTVLANCSLEHVPRLEPALANIRRHLAPEGSFLLFVPAPGWTNTLATKRVVAAYSGRLAGVVGGLFDGFFQHHHLYPDFVWRHLLSGAGFSEIRVVGLGSRAANQLFERHLPSAFAAFVIKALRGRYPRGAWNLDRSRDPRFQAFMAEVESGACLHDDVQHPDVAEYFIHCRR